MNTPSVRFSYLSDDYYSAREIVCAKLTIAVANIIDLPKEIIIQFANLGDSVYGNTSIEHRFKNRVRINFQLTVIELPGPLVHELIHVNQVHVGLLRAQTGVIFWRDRQYRVDPNMTYAQHQALPWEIDAYDRQEQVLKKALEFTKPK